MTFLQPLLLWSLPLALLPVVIHLLNRMRYRSVRWAAMSFLLSANRASTRYARVRQFLILACRVLALAALAIMLARPLAGGWMGWMLSPAPDAVVILLDRSASMEMREPGAQASRREEGLRLVGEAARPLGERSRFVLLESATRQPHEIGSMDALAELSLAGPTDAAADLPAMVEAALDWITKTQPGMTELWIVSDLQRSNWQPDATRWSELGTRLAALPQGVRVRMLAMTAPGGENAALRVKDVARRDAELGLAMEVARTAVEAAAMPVALELNGTRSQVELELEGQSTRVRRSFNMEGAPETGWGSATLPADANPADNAAYFVHGPRAFLRTALVAEDEASRAALRLAAAPAPAAMRQSADVVGADLAGVELERYALVIWQAAMPAGDVAARLMAFVEEGGVVVFFPAGDGAFGGMRWGGEEDSSARVARWDRRDGPLADTEEGIALPLGEMEVKKRRGIAGDGVAWASFADGAPFLTHRAVGKGQVVFCATLPAAPWSGLRAGPVIVPMIQRLLAMGGERLGVGNDVWAGELSDVSGWSRVEGGSDPRTQVGVYRNGARLMAVNRPPIEDDWERLEASAATGLLAPVEVRLFEERSGAGGRLQGEIWRALLVGMLVLLIAEAALILPGRARGEVAA